MGEEGSMGGTKRTAREPMVKPEGGGRAIKNINNGNASISVELISNDFP
jgi:hypothetical protein